MHYNPMKAILILLAALTSSPAGAGPNDPDWPPPARYDREPTMPVRIAEVHPFTLQGICGRMMGFKPGEYFRGCTIPSLEGVCYIFIIDRPAYGTTPRAVYRHERAHCASNGWKH